MNTRLTLAVLALAALTAPRAASAAEDGQLWEVTMKMDASKMPEMKGRDVPPGMAERMGEHTTQICREADTREMFKKSKDMKDCDVKDFKESGTTVTMKLDCKKDARKADVKVVFNKAHTEYKSTIHVVDNKGHDMDMTADGKKIGTCDLAKAQQEKKDRRAEFDRMKAQAEQGQANADAYSKKAEATQIENCAKAVEKMDPEGLGYFGMCHGKKHDANCETIIKSMGSDTKSAKACTAKADEFCERYQTPEGYLLLSQGGRLDSAAQMCGVGAEDLRPKLCKAAVKNDSYEFIGTHCPSDAKPLAKAHCAGRSYTAKDGDPRAVEKKWRKFCVAVAGRGLEGDSETQHASSSGGEEEPTDVKGASKKAAKKAAVNALKGLFGH